MIQRLIALLVLICLSPILGITYLLVKFDSEGPFVFKQLRAGINKKSFWMYKIRTMKTGAETQQNKLREKNEADGPVFKIKKDPRFTRVGKVISHLGLDESLQLINIIKGEMAFVGPRPLPVLEARAVPKKFQPRFSVLPGITSLWVVKGAQHQNFHKWMADDLNYLKTKSLKTDLTIISKSIIMLLLIAWKQLKTKKRY